MGLKVDYDVLELLCKNYHDMHHTYCSLAMKTLGDEKKFYEGCAKGLELAIKSLAICSEEVNQCLLNGKEYAYQSPKI